MRRTLSLLLVLALLPGLAGQADQVYKWVDAQGNVHYSDKPHPGAKKVQVVKPQSYAAPAPPAGNAETGDRRPPPPEKKAPRQYTLTISSPAQGATIRNTRSVTVSVSVTPGLAQGDVLIFSLDGNNRGPLHNTTSVTYDDVDRGAHTVTATLITAGGQTIQATPVTFYLHQATVFRGKPPN
ncbi:MAG TPA: DUF4124 domain-containing protein [Gammaproteobacteria bacterium]|nr:DUF4124 domain-containing protein [Gammaproteobacteria bacterium]